MNTVRKRALLAARKDETSLATQMRVLLPRLAVRAQVAGVPFSVLGALAASEAAMFASRCAALPAPLRSDLEHLVATACGLRLGTVTLDYTCVATGADPDGPLRLFPHRLELAAEPAGDLTLVDLSAARLANCPVYAIRASRPVVQRVALRFGSWIKQLGRAIPVDPTQVIAGWSPLTPLPQALKKLDRAAGRADVHTVRAALTDDDWVLAAWAATLPPGAWIVDLRTDAGGAAFHWGLSRIFRDFRRHPSLPLFALTPSPESQGAWAFVTGSETRELARCRAVLSAGRTAPLASTAVTEPLPVWPTTAHAEISPARR